MYAVMTSGGKQYKVEEGEILRVEKIPGDVGSSVTFDEVLMISDGDDVNIGQPVLDDASVEGHIVEQGKAKKIIVFKYKRRKRYRRKQGHRQQFTAVKIDSIKAKAPKAPKKSEAETEAKKETKEPAVTKVEARETAARVDAKKIRDQHLPYLYGIHTIATLGDLRQQIKDIAVLLGFDLIESDR